MSTAATEAYVSSSGKKFASLTLAAFTPQRAAVAAEMGMKWPNIGSRDRITIDIEAPGEGGKKRKIKIQHYRQSFKDSVFALWLCAQPDSRIDEAEIDPDEARHDAWEWAKEIGLNANSQLAGEALTVWLTIIMELIQSRAEPAPKHGIERDDEPGEL